MYLFPAGTFTRSRTPQVFSLGSLVIPRLYGFLSRGCRLSSAATYTSSSGGSQARSGSSSSGKPPKPSSSEMSSSSSPPSSSASSPPPCSSSSPPSSSASSPPSSSAYSPPPCSSSSPPCSSSSSAGGGLGEGLGSRRCGWTVFRRARWGPGGGLAGGGLGGGSALEPLENPTRLAKPLIFFLIPPFFLAACFNHLQTQ